MGSDVVFLVIKLSKLGREELTHITNRADTVPGRFRFKRFEQDTPIYQVDKYSTSCRYLRHSGVLAHPEDRAGEAGYPAGDFRKIYGQRTAPRTKRAFSVRSISYGLKNFTLSPMQTFGILIFLTEFAATSCVTTSKR